MLNAAITWPNVKVDLVPQGTEEPVVQAFRLSLSIVCPHRIDEGLFLTTLPLALPHALLMNHRRPILMVEPIHPVPWCADRPMEPERRLVVAPQWLSAQATLAILHLPSVTPLIAPAYGDVPEAGAAACGELLAQLAARFAWSIAVPGVVRLKAFPWAASRLWARAAGSRHGGAVRDSRTLHLPPHSIVCCVEQPDPAVKVSKRKGAEGC